MAFRRFHHINTSSFDAGVSQKIRQLCYILFQAVKADRKQVPEVMRKNLLRLHTRRLAQPLHFAPDVCTADRLSRSRDKHRPRSNFVPFTIPLQFLPQPLRQKYLSLFSFAFHNCRSRPHCLSSNKLQFRNTNPRVAQGFHDIKQPLALPPLIGKDIPFPTVPAPYPEKYIFAV